MNKTKLCTVLLWVAFAQISNAFLYAQPSVRLTGGWQFLKEDLGSVWEAVRPYSAGDPQSVPLWQNVTLPHCFNPLDAVDPDVNYYQGPGWYRTQLTINNPYENGRTVLHFEGAGQKTKVYIYTTEVGGHTGGYDEWSVDITKAVTDFEKTEVYKKQFKGKIPVEIRCDNSRDVQMIPSGMSDFNLYGGLYRYVDLVYAPELSIDKLFAHTDVDEKGNAGAVSLRLRLYNPVQMRRAKVQIELRSPLGNIIQSKENTLVDLSGDIPLEKLRVKKPLLWSPDAPQLYTIIAHLTFDGGEVTDSTQVGFRNFKFADKGPFFLNGKRLLLQGVHRHEDHAGVGAAMTEGMIRTEMLMIKEMGANFIRLAHYQQSPVVLHLCDSLGILVWEEEPWCRGGLGNDSYKQQARRMLTNMIEQHYNHPAIIIWGLGNEIDWPGDFPGYSRDSIRAFVKEQNELAHKLDPSRVTGLRRCDFAKDIVDVYSPSIWAGWYRGVYTEYKQSAKEEFDKVKHFIHIEWGADSHAGRHSENPDKALTNIKTDGGTDERTGDASLYGGAARVSKDGDWSETYACNLVDWYLKEQETMPWLTGSAYWTFKDFSTPLRPDNPVPYVNQKGIVERDFTKKEMYYVFQSYWSKKPMAHLYGHSWPVRWGDDGEAKMVKVYSNCKEAELFVNGKSYGVKKRNSQDFPAAGLRWLVPMHAGEYHFKVVAHQGNTMVEDSVTQTYQTAKWGKPATIELRKIADEKDTATLEAQFFDANHVKCLDAKNWVIFGLTGDGKLLDDLGTSSGSRKVQLYNGRTIIKVQKNNGKNVLSVSSEGLSTTFINF